MQSLVPIGFQSPTSHSQHTTIRIELDFVCAIDTLWATIPTACTCTDLVEKTRIFCACKYRTIVYSRFTDWVSIPNFNFCLTVRNKSDLCIIARLQLVLYVSDTLAPLPRRFSVHLSGSECDACKLTDLAHISESNLATPREKGKHKAGC